MCLNYALLGTWPGDQPHQPSSPIQTNQSSDCRRCGKDIPSSASEIFWWASFPLHLAWSRWYQASGYLPDGWASLWFCFSSPAVCTNALQHAVKDSKESEVLLPEITRHFYVDNWFASFPSTIEAISTAHQLTEALKIGDFPLKQWATPNETVRKSVQGLQHEGASINMDLDPDSIKLTLTLVWDFRRDVFVLVAKAEPSGRTKRNLGNLGPAEIHLQHLRLRWLSISDSIPSEGLHARYMAPQILLGRK